MPAASSPVRLAIALDGAGWHPAAWRLPTARPRELFTASYWVELTREAERGLVDFVTFEDALGPRVSADGTPTERVDRLAGRLDSVLIAARVAPLTRHIGLVPTVIVTHTEPFHASKAIATLDHVSQGRAGVRVKVSTRPDEAAHFGRRTVPDVRVADLVDPVIRHHLSELFDEAADYVEVLRRLWDSWEDDAEIRDATTGRFIDRRKIHYIDFVGRRFSVKGPSITPRPPQGQPIVAALAHRDEPFRLVGRVADIGFVTPQRVEEIRGIIDEIGGAWSDADRTDDAPLAFGDLVVFLDDTEAAARARWSRLDELDGEQFTSDARVFAGTPSQLADLLLRWRRAGLSGFRLRPATIPHDLVAITRGLVPELRLRRAYRDSYPADSLRGLLGMAKPVNRFVA